MPFGRVLFRCCREEPDPKLGPAEALEGKKSPVPVHLHCWPEGNSCSFPKASNEAKNNLKACNPLDLAQSAPHA